jgi:mRNA-decapping enzyme subunit 2
MWSSPHERRSLLRLYAFYQAHWYYEDFLADVPHSGLPHLNLRTFALRLFEFSEVLWPVRHMYDAFFKDFMAYKGQIPTYGCIMVNASLDAMVLVCNWKGSSWGFPKGKLNEREDGAACAQREVEEETGYRASGLSEEDSITVVLAGGQRTKMFIVPDVPEDHPFEPLARKEISKIQFFPFDQPPKSAWNVSQFVPGLKRWVKQHRKKQRAQRAAAQAGQASREQSVKVAGAMVAAVNSAGAWAGEQAAAPQAIDVQSLFGDSAGGGGSLSASVASLFGAIGGDGNGGSGNGVSGGGPDTSPKSVTGAVLLRPPLPVEASADLATRHAPGRPPRHPPAPTAATAAPVRGLFVFDIDDIMAAIPTLPAPTGANGAHGANGTAAQAKAATSARPQQPKRGKGKGKGSKA